MSFTTSLRARPLCTRVVVAVRAPVRWRYVYALKGRKVIRLPRRKRAYKKDKNGNIIPLSDADRALLQQFVPSLNAVIIPNKLIYVLLAAAARLQ